VPPVGPSPFGAACKTEISPHRVPNARRKRGASSAHPTSASWPRSGARPMPATKKAGTNHKSRAATAAVLAAAAGRPRRRGRSPHGRWIWAKLGDSKPHERQNDLGCWGIDVQTSRKAFKPSGQSATSCVAASISPLRRTRDGRRRERKLSVNLSAVALARAEAEGRWRVCSTSCCLRFTVTGPSFRVSPLPECFESRCCGSVRDCRDPARRSARWREVP
jgi:hypothetical protein